MATSGMQEIDTRRADAVSAARGREFWGRDVDAFVSEARAGCETRERGVLLRKTEEDHGGTSSLALWRLGTVQVCG